MVPDSCVICIIFTLVAYLPLGPDSSKGAPSPSALFARRLMHFCSAEVVAQATTPIVSFHDVPPLSKTPFFPYPAPASPTHSNSQEGPNDDTMENPRRRARYITHPRTGLALKAHAVAPCPLVSPPSLDLLTRTVLSQSPYY